MGEIMRFRWNALGSIFVASFIALPAYGISLATIDFLVEFVGYQVFPSYYHYSNFFWRDSMYQEGKIAFPGDRIAFPLGQDALEGVYGERNIRVLVNGKLVAGIQDYNRAPDAKVIFYKKSALMFHNVGDLSFVLPNDKALFGRRVTVEFGLAFFSPEIIEGTDKFRWTSRPLKGRRFVQLGTLHQYSNELMMRRALWFLPILIAVVVWLFWALKIQRSVSAEK